MQFIINIFQLCNVCFNSAFVSNFLFWSYSINLSQCPLDWFSRGVGGTWINNCPYGQFCCIFFRFARPNFILRCQVLAILFYHYLFWWFFTMKIKTLFSSINFIWKYLQKWNVLKFWTPVLIRRNNTWFGKIWQAHLFSIWQTVTVPSVIYSMGRVDGIIISDNPRRIL
jgi:hypothetical protein